MSITSNSPTMLGTVLPALVVGPIAAAIASSHGILAAVVSGPLAASAVTLGLAAWIGLGNSPRTKRATRARATAHFEPVWHGTAHG
ncbi:hypothetical protein [Methylobacterium symbioticum]|nr:hypothetical protein [Methylobacterium symbioticum]